MLSRWNVVPVVWACVAAMAGCASYEVRSVGAGGGPSAYTLEGNNLEQLHLGAARLCPKGYEVSRQWDRMQSGIHRREGYFTNKWLRVTDFVNSSDNHAQLAVQCKS